MTDSAAHGISSKEVTEIRFTGGSMKYKLTRSPQIADSASGGKSSKAAMGTRHDIFWPEQTHVGVSWLRTQNAAALWQLQRVMIFHSHAKPVAVLIPYETFILWQAVLKDAWSKPVEAAENSEQTHETR